MCIVLIPGRRICIDSLCRSRMAVGWRLWRKAQGIMLGALQNEIRDRRFESEKQTLVEPKAGEYFHEVAVSVRVKGEAAEIMKWLITLQQPNQFYVIKYLEVELDKKSQKKEPQALCNLTLARWFKPLEPTS